MIVGTLIGRRIRGLAADQYRPALLSIAARAVGGYVVSAGDGLEFDANAKKLKIIV